MLPNALRVDLERGDVQDVIDSLAISPQIVSRDKKAKALTCNLTRWINKHKFTGT